MLITEIKAFLTVPLIRGNGMSSSVVVTILPLLTVINHGGNLGAECVAEGKCIYTYSIGAFCRGR